MSRHFSLWEGLCFKTYVYICCDRVSMQIWRFFARSRAGAHRCRRLGNCGINNASSRRARRCPEIVISRRHQKFLVSSRVIVVGRASRYICSGQWHIRCRSSSHCRSLTFVTLKICIGLSRHLRPDLAKSGTIDGIQWEANRGAPKATTSAASPFGHYFTTSAAHPIRGGAKALTLHLVFIRSHWKDPFRHLYVLECVVR
mmetsp:Transcript_53719/g.85504  ORF Transcript_53719/g.85504 Transcript_53719/m.85504 type:complete len:200 (+) Transcript_53719:351-950(+)